MSEQEYKANMTARVFGAIEEGGVAPKPRWHFLLHEGVVWFVAALSLALGSLATALTLYIGNASFFMERHIALSDLSGLFMMVPYVWLLLIGLGVFYSIHALHATKGGYRWHTSWLVGVAIGLSLGVGWSINASGASEVLDRYLLSEVPMYQPLSGFQPMHWMDPDSGVVAGFVEEVGEEMFIVQMLDGKTMEVTVTTETVVPPMFEMCEGMPVRVVGTTTHAEEVDTFEATEVQPFRGRGPRQGSGMGQGSGRGAAMGRMQLSEDGDDGVARSRDAR